MWVSLDIETEAAPPEGREILPAKDKLALYPHTNRITCIGIVDQRGTQQVHRNFGAMREAVFAYSNTGPGLELIGHNFKFDLKNICFRDQVFPLEWWLKNWRHDTMLMAYVSTTKVPQSYLDWYEQGRAIKNKELPQGYSHRQAGARSLKTLAPYFLGVAPFWEDPTNHDNDEYVLKDVNYTLQLGQKFYHEIMTDQEREFYDKYQMPWTKQLLRAEMIGVKLDYDVITKLEQEAQEHIQKAKAKVDKNWEDSYARYGAKIVEETQLKYQEMFEAQLEKGPKDPEKTRARYVALCSNKLGKLKETDALKINLNSPVQLSWLLKEDLGYDITKFTGDESTDKEVLERLAPQHDDVKDFLDYRHWAKLCSTYYPSYRKFDIDGRIHCTFNAAGARTGRLSCSEPNLQNQPPITRQVFIPDEGHKFIIMDLSAIEPTVAAHFTQDPLLTELVKGGGDFHGETAKAIFPYIDCPNHEVKTNYPSERNVAKTAGLATLYGSGATRLLVILEKAGFNGYTKAQCKTIIDRIRARYRGVWEYKLKLDRKLEAGLVQLNLFGRPFKFTNRDDVYMKGFNQLIQGSASDLVQEAALKFNKECDVRGNGGRVLLLIHDELIAQIKEGEDAEISYGIMKEAMTRFKLEGDIPLRVEGQIADRWVK